MLYEYFVLLMMFLLVLILLKCFWELIGLLSNYHNTQKQKRMMWGVEDPAQEHQSPWDHRYMLFPWDRRWPYRLRDWCHSSRPSVHIYCAGEVFHLYFLYCFTLCTDALICWQGLCMITRGTNLDTYHQTTIPIPSLSSVWLYKAYPSNHVQNHYASVEIFQIFPSMNISV